MIPLIALYLLGRARGDLREALVEPSCPHLKPRDSTPRSSCTSTSRARSGPRRCSRSRVGTTTASRRTRSRVLRGLYQLRDFRALHRGLILTTNALRTGGRTSGRSADYAVEAKARTAAVYLEGIFPPAGASGAARRELGGGVRGVYARRRLGRRRRGTGVEGTADSRHPAAGSASTKRARLFAMRVTLPGARRRSALGLGGLEAGVA